MVRLSFYSALICLLSVTGLSAFAQTQVSREDLFRRAFHSLSFLMTMAAEDPAFGKRLTSQESKMFQYIDSIAQDARNRQWFKANGIQNHPSGRMDNYYYANIPEGPRPKYHQHLYSPVRFGLQFSRDSKLFQIDGKPERTAITTEELDYGIFVNLNKINSTVSDVTFPKAVALLIHEFGHKAPALGLEKDETAIDSLGVKMQAYLESLMSVTQTSAGQVSVLKFKNAPYDRWFEESMTGIYQAVNVPFVYEPLRIFDGEGTYVFLENARGAFDLTPMLFKRLSEENITHVVRKTYDWRDLNWILSSSVDVWDRGAGEISVDVVLNHLQTTIAFLREGAPDPRQSLPYSWAFPGSQPNVGRFEARRFQVSATTGRPRLTMETQRPLSFEAPQVQVKREALEWQGQDFVAKYRFEMPAPASRAYLVVQLNGDRFEIPEVPIATADRGLHEFRLIDVRSKSSGRLEVLGIEVGPERSNLGISMEPLHKVFLDRTEGLEMAGTRPVSQARLLSVQAGEQVLYPISQGAPPQVSYFRFEFAASAPLVSLKIQIRYLLHTEVSTTMTFFNEALPPGHLAPTSVVKWINVDTRHLKQTLRDGRLWVDLPIDEGLILENSVSTSLDFQPELPSFMQNLLPSSAAVETTTTRPGSERDLLSLDFTTANLQNGGAVFAQPLKVVKQSATKDLSCGQIFSR